MATTAAKTLIVKAGNSIEARALAAHLADAGIDAHVAGELGENIFGVNNLGGSGSEVWIRGEDRARAEDLIRAWRQEHGGPAIAEDAKPQFGLRWLFAAMAFVALAGATSRFIGDDLRAFITASVWWFWILLCAASAWAVFRRWSGRADHGDADDPAERV